METEWRKLVSHYRPILIPPLNYNNLPGLISGSCKLMPRNQAVANPRTGRKPGFTARFLFLLCFWKQRSRTGQGGQVQLDARRRAWKVSLNADLFCTSHQVENKKIREHVFSFFSWLIPAQGMKRKNPNVWPFSSKYPSWAST